MFDEFSRIFEKYTISVYKPTVCSSLHSFEKQKANEKVKNQRKANFPSEKFKQKVKNIN